MKLLLKYFSNFFVIFFFLCYFVMVGFPLHEACNKGDLEKVKNLVKKKWDVNGLDERNWTPLHWAANERYLEICKYLLSKGANPSLATNNKATSIHYIARIRDDPLLVSMLKIFVEKGADINCRNTFEDTPLHEAALRGSTVCINFFLDKGADINCQNTYVTFFFFFFFFFF